MSTMIHKVAMAIAEADLIDGPDDTTFDFFALTEEIADGYYRIARAAIEAMKYPTDAMYDAGEAAGGYGVTFSTWEAMIQSALKEEAQ